MKNHQLLTVARKCSVTESTALKRRFVTAQVSLRKAECVIDSEFELESWTAMKSLTLNSSIYSESRVIAVKVPSLSPAHSTYLMLLHRGLNKECFGSHLGNCAGACVPSTLHRQQPGTQSRHVFFAKGPDGISGPLSLSGLAPWNLASWKQWARRAPPAVPRHMLGHPYVDTLSGPLWGEDLVLKQHGYSGVRISDLVFKFKDLLVWKQLQDELLRTNQSKIMPNRQQSNPS